MPNPWLRGAVSTTVVASPALAAETIVGSLVLPPLEGATQRIFLFGWLALTYGATATAVTVRLRQNNVSGTVVANSGATTAGVAAAALAQHVILGVDSPGEVDGFVYVLTVQVTGGSSASTVSAVQLLALLSPS